MIKQLIMAQRSEGERHSRGNATPKLQGGLKKLATANSLIKSY